MRQSKCQSNNKPTKPPKGQKTSCKKLKKKKNTIGKVKKERKKLKEKCHKASIVNVNLKFAVRVLQVCKGARERGSEDTPARESEIYIEIHTYISID